MPQSKAQKTAEKTTREGRQPGARSVEPGLEHVVADELENHEERDREQRRAPAGEGGQRQRDRACRREPRPEVGQETQHRGERSPQHGARNADRGEPDAHRQPVDAADQRLHAEVAAHPLHGVVDGVRGERQVLRADQPEHAIAQLLAFEEHEERQHGDQGRRAEGDRELRQQLAELAEHARGLDHFDLRRGSPFLLFDGVSELVDLLGGAGERSERAAQILDLRAQIRPVLGNLVGEHRRLAGHHPSDPAGSRDEHQEHHHHGRRPTQADALQPAHQRREQEGDQQRQRQGHQQGAAEVEGGDHEDDRRAGRPGRRAGGVPCGCLESQSRIRMHATCRASSRTVRTGLLLAFVPGWLILQIPHAAATRAGAAKAKSARALARILLIPSSSEGWRARARRTAPWIPGSEHRLDPWRRRRCGVGGYGRRARGRGGRPAHAAERVDPVPRGRAAESMLADRTPQIARPTSWHP